MYSESDEKTGELIEPVVESLSVVHRGLALIIVDEFRNVGRETSWLGIGGDGERADGGTSGSNLIDDVVDAIRLAVGHGDDEWFVAVTLNELACKSESVRQRRSPTTVRVK
jgi:hypothetical protein